MAVIYELFPNGAPEPPANTDMVIVENVSMAEAYDIELADNELAKLRAEAKLRRTHPSFYRPAKLDLPEQTDC